MCYIACCIACRTRCFACHIACRIACRIVCCSCFRPKGDFVGNTALTTLDLGAPQPKAIGGELIGSSLIENKILAELLLQKNSDEAPFESLAKKILPKQKVPMCR